MLIGNHIRRIEWYRTPASGTAAAPEIAFGTRRIRPSMSHPTAHMSRYLFTSAVAYFLLTFRFKRVEWNN